jgi:hypothetical protein
MVCFHASRSRRSIISLPRRRGLPLGLLGCTRPANHVATGQGGNRDSPLIVAHKRAGTLPLSAAASTLLRHPRVTILPEPVLGVEPDLGVRLLA